MGIYALDWRTLLSAPASTPLPAEYSRRRVVLRDAMHRMSIMRASCVFIYFHGILHVCSLGSGQAYVHVVRKSGLKRKQEKECLCVCVWRPLLRIV